MWNFIKLWIGGPLAFLTLVANAIRAPSNWGVVMDWLPRWITEDWLRVSVSAFCVSYLLLIAWPIVRDVAKAVRKPAFGSASGVNSQQGGVNRAANSIASDSKSTSLRRLVASVRDDALNYEPHKDEMNNRLKKLDDRKGYFLDSPHAEAFHFFMRDARALIGSKEVTYHGHTGIPFHDSQLLRDSLNKHYEILKEALTS